MAEYISREAVNNLIEDMQNNRLLLVCERTNLYILKSKVAELPAADVQPVKHGRWIWDSNAPHREHGAYKCSNCGCHSDFEENYCYNCGARMDGDAE